MAIAPSKGKFLYHITHIDNMQSILNEGLLSRNELAKRKLTNFTDIADHEILSKRSQYKENLSKYVLFHFYAKNPFDCAVCNTYGAENMVIITIERSLAKINDFKVIPSHPLNKNDPDIYPYDDGIKLINWDILDMAVGRDYNNPDIRSACMAECVMEYIVQPEVFALIYVHNEQARSIIETMNNSCKIELKVNPQMFPKSK